MATGLVRSYGMADLDPANRDKPPRKKSKPTVSISGLFKPPQHSYNTAEHATKGAPPHKSHFVPVAKPKKPEPQHPVYLSFTEAAENYRDGMLVARSDQLEPVYKALVARVRGLDINGKPLKTPGLPSREEAEAFIKEEEGVLSRLLGDVELTLAKTLPDGKIVSEEVTFGESISEFEDYVATKRSELESLFQDLRDVEAEIVAARQHVIAVEQKEVRQAQIAFGEALDEIVKKAEAAAAQTRSDVKKARSHDKAAKQELNKKMEQLMMEL